MDNATEQQGKNKNKNANAVLITDLNTNKIHHQDMHIHVKDFKNRV